jgi:hypothetical protein
MEDLQTTSVILKFNWWDKLEESCGEKKVLEKTRASQSEVELAPEKL